MLGLEATLAMFDRPSIDPIVTSAPRAAPVLPSDDRDVPLSSKDRDAADVSHY